MGKELVDKNNLGFHGYVMIRLASTPLNYELDDLVNLRNDKFFMMGLAYASEDLYKAFLEIDNQEKQEKKDKILDSVYRYFLRSQHRATPFALFAGTSLVRLKKENNLKEINRSIDIDIDHKMLWRKTHKLLSKNLKNRALPIALNSTITEYDDNIHYVKFHSKKDVFKQVQLNKNVLVEYLLKEKDNIHTLGDVLDLEEKYKELKDVNISQYIKELVKINLICFGIFPNTKLFAQTNGVVSSLEELGLDGHSKIPEKIDLEQLSNFPDKKLRKEWGIPKKEKKSSLYKVRLSNLIKDGSFNLMYQNNLKDAAIFLINEQRFSENSNLKQLATDIKNKFGEVEQPILNLFDPSIGIKYSVKEDWMLKNKKPLLKKIIIEDTKKNTIESDPDSELNRFLASKLEDYYSGKIDKIDVSEYVPSDKKNRQNKYKINRLPSDLSLFIESYEKKKAVLLKFIGSPGTAMMSRFLEKPVEQVQHSNQSIDSEFIYAEVIYFPRVKTGNILNRPSKHKYEIWVNDFVPKKENIISLEDLSIFQCQGSVYIKSKRLNKLVIPILNTAYNARLAIPVYQFFHDYSKSFHQDYTWSWGAFSMFKHLPQVVYKNVILSKKSWEVKDKSFENNFSNPLRGDFDEVLKEQKLDSNVNISLKGGDNFLSLDMKKERDRRLFLKELKTKKTLRITEDLTSEKDGVSIGKDIFANEMIVPMYFKKQDKPFHNVIKEKSRDQNYLPGSDYAYIKIYVDENNANTVLRDFLSPFVKENSLKEWHFVRYFDPKGEHLRFRFRKKGLKVDDFLTYYQDHKHPMIHAIVVDTFYPEYKRYGFLNYDFTEKLFELDSNATLDFFRLEESSNELEQVKFALANVYSYLNSFYDKNKIVVELRNFSNMLKSEFSIDNTENNKKINELFRELENDLMGFKSYLPLLKEREEFIALEEGKDTVMGRLWSYTHMCVNRIFDYKFRLQEAIVYDLLRIIMAKELYSKKQKKNKEELVEA